MPDPIVAPADHNSVPSHVVAPTLAIMAAFTLLLTSIFFYDAVGSVKAVASILVAYALLSIVLHPVCSVRNDPFSLFVITKMVMLIGMIFSCLYVSKSGQYSDESSILVTLAITLVTFLVADVGVWLIPSRRTQAPHNLIPKFEFRVFFFLWIAGWLWRAFALSRGLLYGTLLATRLDLTGSSNALGTLNAVAGFSMWGCVVFSSRPLRALPLVVLEILWLLGTSSKGALIYILIPFLMILHQRRLLKIGRKFVVLMSVIILSSFIVFSLVRGYRIAAVTQVAVYGYENFDPLEAAKDVQLTAGHLKVVGNAVAERFNYAERLVMIIDGQKEHPSSLWYGKSYLTALVWFIPRAVWPDKPTMGLGRWFATEYLGWSDESRSEAGITIWGEAFLNFGLLGALLLPGLWIVLLQAIYRNALSFGPWGLLFAVSGYVVMANSIAVNIAVPIAHLGQLLILTFLVKSGIRIVAAVGRSMDASCGG